MTKLLILIVLCAISLQLLNISQLQVVEDDPRDIATEYLDSNIDTFIMHPETAVKLLQRSLNAEHGSTLELDGILGAQTINTYNEWRYNEHN